MFFNTNSSEGSVWLKPVFRSLSEKVIDCHKPKPINYYEIQSGDILDLEVKDSYEKVYKRTFIATSNWSKNVNCGGFINLNGKQIVLSDKILEKLNVCMIGSLVN